MNLTHQQINAFRESLWQHYAQYGRPDLPWRLPEKSGAFDPYHILVSEIMLQQTQVSRVIPKYESFLQHFPTVQSLATAQLGTVLREWQGLGYNRRAKFLWQAARILAAQAAFPTTSKELTALPGVGLNTAAAILVYTYNQPFIFIETNVRTVYIHEFFSAKDGVDDTEILELVEQTLDRENPRDFFWALMDYGSHLKTTVGNLNKVSKSYAKQSAFTGSLRQIRGQVIRELSGGSKTKTTLAQNIPDVRLVIVLDNLLAEQLIHKQGSRYTLDSPASMLQ